VTSIALIDTSIYIGQEHKRPMVANSPSIPAVSIVTVAELRAGVLTAPDERSRAIRRETLRLALASVLFLVDEPVAEAWAELRRALRELKRRMPGNDSWIAATALAYGLPVVTQDEDYAVVPGLEVIRL
jgi:predicted nucleic acid-binding protein